MNFELKFILAALLIVVGMTSAFHRIRRYKTDSRQALTEDLLDLIFFLPQLIFSATLVLIGAGWLYHLITSG